MKCCTDEPLFAILLFLFSNIKISRNKINNAKTTFFDLDLLNAYATVVPITQCLYFVYRKCLLFYCIFTNYWSLVVIVPDFCIYDYDLSFKKVVCKVTVIMVMRVVGKCTCFDLKVC